MPRQLQSKIHSDFSSETYKWEIYQSQLQDLFDTYTNTEDFNDHLVREYNRKINRLNKSQFLYINPYDGGYRLINNVVDGLRLSLDLNFDSTTTYTQGSVGDSSLLLSSRYGPNPQFSRLSSATFLNSAGLIERAPENLLTYSEDFFTSWIKPAIAVSVNEATSPLGTLTADLIYPSSSGSAREIYKSYAYTTGSSHTISVYAKYAGKQWITLGTNNGSIANRCAWFDVLNGTKGQVASGYQSHIESVGNGWYRLIVVLSSSTDSYFDISIVDSDGSGSVTKNGTSGIYIWGAQLERHTSARPYISTTSAAVYGPRFEYDTSGNPKGLLMEESSTNLLQYSAQFDNPYWAKSSLNTTGTPAWINVATAPDGLPTGDRLMEDTSTPTSYHGVYAQYSVTAGTNYSFSVFVKMVDGRNAGVLVGYTSDYNGAYIDLGDGSVLGGEGTYTASTSSAGNGWYRVTVNWTASTTAGAFFRVVSSIGTSRIYQGNGTSGIYIWGAQLEQKPFATSYIPTVGGSATRSADSCTVNIDFPLSWFNESEGTIMVEGDRLHDPALNAGLYDSLFVFNAGSSASLAHFGDGASEFFAVADGSYIVTALSVSLPNQPLLFVGSYSASSSEVFVSTNNTATQSQAGFSSFSTPDTITFGYSAGVGEYLNGHIKSFKYYKKSLDSTIIEALPL